MLESKNNPLVGFVRHSPSSISKSMGLKRIISEDPSIKPPILTQLQLKRNEMTSSPLTEKNFVRSLKQIPTSVYSSSEVQSPSRRGSIKLDENSEDQCLCAICMEAYADGDEILTLACAHCYHSECASKWFYQDCLNSAHMESNFSCPKCRKNHHATLSEVGSSSSLVTTEDNLGISTTLLQIGQSLINEGGYDFLSDFGAESPYENGEARFVPKSPYRISPTKCIQRQRSSSTVNSCPSTTQPTNENDNESNGMTQENNQTYDPQNDNNSVEDISTSIHTLSIQPQVTPMKITHLPKPLPSPAGSVLSFSTWSDCGVPLQ